MIQQFQLPLGTKTKLDIRALVERELENFLVWETPGIEKCVVRCENHGDDQYQILATQGINVQVISFLLVLRSSVEIRYYSDVVLFLCCFRLFYLCVSVFSASVLLLSLYYC